MENQVEIYKSKFELAMKEAANLDLQNNSCAAFQATVFIKQLREVLTDEVVRDYFKPLMNTKIGFRTDKDPARAKAGHTVEPYSLAVIRDCIIDAASIGLLPTGNQFNIISGNMYPTKEGYTALLKKIGCKYYITPGQDLQKPDAPFAEIPCQINFEFNGEKNGFKYTAIVKKDSYSSADQLRGKAERRAKKTLYEYLTGCDFGDADEDSSAPVASRALERAERANSGEDEGYKQMRAQKAEDVESDEPGF